MAKSNKPEEPDKSGKSEKPEKAEKSDDQILITRAILEEVKQHIGIRRTAPDDQVLAWMRQMVGRPIKLVETLPDDDEETVVICSLVPVVPGSLIDKCSDCGATIYHSRNAPPKARKICTRCGPRLGH